MKYQIARSNKTNMIYLAHIPSKGELLPPEDIDWVHNISEIEFNLKKGNFISDFELLGKRCSLYEQKRSIDRVIINVS